jgi:hypothetical protein
MHQGLATNLYFFFLKKKSKVGPVVLYRVIFPREMATGLAEIGSCIRSCGPGRLVASQPGNRGGRGGCSLVRWPIFKSVTVQGKSMFGSDSRCGF